MFWLRYYKMVQILYKNWLLVSKITWGIWTTSDKQWKVQKVEIRWVTFVQKIHSTKTLYTEDSSNITFNYLRKSSSNSSCHFWNQKSFFATQLVCIIPAQTLHTFYKSSPSKCKFLDSPNSNSLCHFSCKNFSSKFGSLFVIDKSSTSKCKLSDLPLKIHQIPHVIFGTKNQFFFKLCITASSLSWDVSLLHFFI